MVNFRFHLVSLVAVFLALGVGIIVGSTVIDQATVQGLERNVEALERQRDDARGERDALRSELGRWDDLSAELPGETVAGRLPGVPVLVVGVDGVPRDMVEDVHVWLLAAGADDQGTLWLTDRLAVEEAGDRRTLAQIVGSTATRPEAVQRAALDAVAAALTPSLPPPGTTPTAGPLLPSLRDAGFVTWDAPDGGALDLASVPALGARLVVVSGAGARLPDAGVAVPLTHLLADRGGTAVVAAEGATGDGKEGDDRRAVFVGALRDDGELRRRISTVDNLELPYGRMALVLALEDLAGGAVGHYGLAADRLLPAPNR